MSYDFDTRQTNCDHYQRRERLVLDSEDFRTLITPDGVSRMRGILAAQNSLKLRMGGKYVDPFDPVYGYQVVIDPDSLEKRYKIVFNRQIRLQSLIIEAEYFSTGSSCLKCNGYGKTNNFVKSNRGGFLHITEQNKLLHRVNKFLLTSRCNFYPGLTSQLKEFVGRKFGMSLTESDISQECVTALEHLRDIQITQKQVQQLTPQEILRNVESVTSVRDPDDPTIVTTQVVVSSYGQVRPTPLTFVLRTNN